MEDEIQHTTELRFQFSHLETNNSLPIAIGILMGSKREKYRKGGGEKDISWGVKQKKMKSHRCVKTAILPETPWR